MVVTLGKVGMFHGWDGRFGCVIPTGFKPVVSIHHGSQFRTLVHYSFCHGTV